MQINAEKMGENEKEKKKFLSPPVGFEPTP